MEYLLRKRIIVYKGKEVIVEVLKTFADITPEGTNIIIRMKFTSTLIEMYPLAL